ncbi:MAG: hypothetical protein QXH07_03205 [Thermoplasmata archaeon]
MTELTTNEYVNLNSKLPIEYWSEMPFCYTTKKYYIKSYFDIYPQISTPEDSFYVTYPRGSIKEVQDIVNQYNTNHKLILEKGSTIEYNLQDKFNEFLYIKSPYWFDTHPRLFLECEYYGKPYYYVNKLNVKDGSWYRYYEVKENGLKNHTLTIDDDIVKELD